MAINIAKSRGFLKLDLVHTFYIMAIQEVPKGVIAKSIPAYVGG
jgi:hypothetical protein